MQAYWDRRAAELAPALRFGNCGMDFPVWQERTLERLLKLLGEFPEKVPLEAEVEYSVEEEDFIRERVVFDSEAYMSVPCQVLIPRHFKKDRSQPAILCVHGHGSFGKDPVAGLVSTPGHQADIDLMNYDYGAQMARKGYLGHEVLCGLSVYQTGGGSRAHRHDGYEPGRNCHCFYSGGGAPDQGGRRDCLYQPFCLLWSAQREFLRFPDSAGNPEVDGYGRCGRTHCSPVSDVGDGDGGYLLLFPGYVAGVSSCEGNLRGGGGGGQALDGYPSGEPRFQRQKGGRIFCRGFTEMLI